MRTLHFFSLRHWQHHWPRPRFSDRDQSGQLNTGFADQWAVDVPATFCIQWVSCKEALLFLMICRDKALDLSCYFLPFLQNQRRFVFYSRMHGKTIWVHLDEYRTGGRGWKNEWMLCSTGPWCRGELLVWYWISPFLYIIRPLEWLAHIFFLFRNY